MTATHLGDLVIQRQQLCKHPPTMRRGDLVFQRQHLCKLSDLVFQRLNMMLLGDLVFQRQDMPQIKSISDTILVMLEGDLVVIQRQ